MVSKPAQPARSRLRFVSRAFGWSCATAAQRSDDLASLRHSSQETVGLGLREGHWSEVQPAWIHFQWDAGLGKQLTSKVWPAQHEAGTSASQAGPRSTTLLKRHRQTQLPVCCGLLRDPRECTKLLCKSFQAPSQVMKACLPSLLSVSHAAGQRGGSKHA